jgi:TolA-binding protein
MRTCLFFAAVEQWTRQGAFAPMPDALGAHLKHCDRCSTLVDSVQRTRELARRMPIEALHPTQLETLKFQLMAEARRSKNDLGVGFTRTRFSVRALGIAAIVATAAATATATHHYGKAAARPDGERGATVSAAAAGARELSPLAMRWQDGAHAVTLSATRLGSLPKPSAKRERSPASLQAIEPSPAPPGSSIEAASDADSEFTLAWSALQTKRPAEAAQRFDALLASSSLDPSRRADILYWSAQSHRQAGNTNKAKRRSSQLLQQYPNGAFVADAALMLGEFAMASDQFVMARQYLTQASRSPHTVVRDRAKHALAELEREPKP